MATAQNPELITYVDSSRADWREFRPGSRRKVLYEDAARGQLTMLVQWDPGYRMGGVEHPASPRTARDKQTARPRGSRRFAEPHRGTCQRSSPPRRALRRAERARRSGPSRLLGGLSSD